MIGELGKLVVRVVARSKVSTEFSVFAMAKVAETLLSLVSEGLADFLGDVAGQYKRRIEARTQLEEAAAQKRMLEAVKLANLEIERSELHQVKLQREQLKNDEQEQKLALAEARLREALSRLKIEGGRISLDQTELKKRSTPAKGKKPRPKKEE